MSNSAVNNQDSALRSEAPNPFAIAAGMLRNDRVILLPLLLLLGAPVLFEALDAINSLPVPFLPIVLNRLCQIGVFAFVALRWRKRLASAGGNTLSFFTAFWRIGLVSIAISIVLLMPWVLALGAGGAGGSFVLMLLVGLGLLWTYRMYLFFAVVGLLGMPLVAGMAKSAELARGNIASIARSLIAPCAYTLLLVGASQIPYPDGRSLSWLLVGSVAEGIFWILSTYTGLALALTLFSDSDWRRVGLDHYRTERLATLAKQGGIEFTKFLSPRFSLAILGVAVLVWAGNLVRQFSEPPVAKVAIKDVVVEAYKIKLALTVEDAEYDFRGFQPLAFSIRTATGGELVDRLDSVSRAQEKAEQVLMLTKKDAPSTTLYYTFATPKSEAALTSLDNMWIWYKFKPLLAVEPERLKKDK